LALHKSTGRYRAFDPAVGFALRVVAQLQGTDVVAQLQGTDVDASVTFTGSK
jgi:hypothetical protein